MIKIKIYELEKHRNETTFRPLLMEHEYFNQIGIQFVRDGKSDFAFVGQASIADKKLSLNESIEFGLNFLKTVKEPYVIFDGQDSTSLIGTYDVFKQSKAIHLFKNNLLKDRSLYKNKYINGRYIWGSGGDYNCEDIDKFNNKIKLSGFNWLNTYGNKINITSFSKNRPYDVCSLIGISKENYEHAVRTDVYYNKSRHIIFEEVKNLKCNTITTEKTGKLNKQEYFSKLLSSKICISPYGYGEIAIRDIEAISAGCIIIKPDMSLVDTIPNVYDNGVTYISCKDDYSDLNDKVNYVLENYDSIYEKIYSNLVDRCEKEFSSFKLIKYYHEFFSNLPNISV
jgi:hypothetical protein